MAEAEELQKMLEDTENIDMGLIESYLHTLPEKAMNLGMKVVLAVIVFLIGIQIIKGIRKITKRTLEKANADLGVIQFLDALLKVVLYTLLFLMIATGFGMEATSIVALAGSLGVAIGLALQGSMSNLAGGVLILLLKPFRVGDYIKEDTNNNEGTVVEIRLFYTKLETVDKKTIIVPNGALSNASLTNYTESTHRMLEIVVGISYQSSVKKAKEILETILKEEGRVVSDFPRLVFVKELGSSSVDMGLRCTVANGDYWAVKWDINEKIKDAFDAEGIEIPYQQLDVHVVSMGEGDR